MHPPLIFAGHALDRATHRRGDAAWLASFAAQGRAGYLAVNSEGVAADGDRLAFAPVVLPDAGPPVFLGLVDEVAYFSQLVGQIAPEGVPGMVELRSIAASLTSAEASLAVYAVALARWDERHRFCGVCGHATSVADAGHRRLCPQCGAEHFPRTDPAIIVLIEEGDACFLAHNARYKAGMHSTLAGFVEPGETLEQAVAREVMEEAAIELAEIAYQGSQPWPFPASLMLGFRARAVSRDFSLDGVELLEGGWFTREFLRDCLETSQSNEQFSLPGSLSISRRLIADWIAEI